MAACQHQRNRKWSSLMLVAIYTCRCSLGSNTYPGVILAVIPLDTHLPQHTHIPVTCVHTCKRAHYMPGHAMAL